MAVLEKIRVKLGALITILIALALLSFIIDPSTLEMTLRSLSSKYDVGKIDGKSISYETFQKKVDYYTNIYTMTSGSQSMTQEAQDAINYSAWQDFESELFVLPLIKKSGINVGEDELVDMTQGENVSPILANERAFIGTDGKFSREQFMQFIQAIPSDQSGRLKEYWNFLENNMIRQQYFTKYTSLLSHNILNPIELRRSVEDNNITSDCEFIVVPAGFAPDSTIKVSDAEIKSYYNEHKKDYKVKASRDIEFVAFEVTPSEKDFQDAKSIIDAAYKEFETTDNLKAFLLRNSDTPLNEYYYKKGELVSQYPEIDAFAFGGKEKTLPVFKKGEQYIAARVAARKQMPDSVYVQHILLSAEDAPKADSLIKELNKGADFSAMAAQYSLDKNPNVTPGDLGWLTQSYMLPGLESVMDLVPGKITTIQSNYGLHIVKVKERTKLIDKAQIAMLTKDVIASKETYQIYYSQANDLASRANGKIAEFDKVVAEDNLPSVPVNAVMEGARRISKYDNAREVSRWIYEAKEGDVSPIITVDNKYFFVVALRNITKEGYKPVEDVKAEIRFKLEGEKRIAKLQKEVETKVAGLKTMEEMAQALNTTVSKKEDVAFGAFTNRSFEPALVGAVAGLEPGKISAPIAGTVGVYIVKVNNRETGSFFKEEDAVRRDKQLQGYQLNTLQSIFNEMADIKDNRARFY